jgi:hypothetical protein
MLGRPDIFCWVVATAGNLYLIYMLLWQRRTRRRLERAVLSDEAVRA